MKHNQNNRNMLEELFWMHANERPYGWAVGYKQFPFLGLSDCLVGQTLHNQCQNTHTHTHARVAHTLAQARLDPLLHKRASGQEREEKGVVREVGWREWGSEGGRVAGCPWGFSLWLLRRCCCRQRVAMATPVI